MAIQRRDLRLGEDDLKLYGKSFERAKAEGEMKGKTVTHVSHAWQNLKLKCSRLLHLMKTGESIHAKQIRDLNKNVEALLTEAGTDQRLPLDKFELDLDISALRNAAFQTKEIIEQLKVAKADKTQILKATQHLTSLDSALKIFVDKRKNVKEVHVPVRKGNAALPGRISVSKDQRVLPRPQTPKSSVSSSSTDRSVAQKPGNSPPLGVSSEPKKYEKTDLGVEVKRSQDTVKTEAQTPQSAPAAKQETPTVEVKGEPKEQSNEVDSKELRKSVAKLLGEEKQGSIKLTKDQKATLKDFIKNGKKQKEAFNVVKELLEADDRLSHLPNKESIVKTPKEDLTPTSSRDNPVERGSLKDLQVLRNKQYDVRPFNESVRQNRYIRGELTSVLNTVSKNLDKASAQQRLLEKELNDIREQIAHISTPEFTKKLKANTEQLTTSNEQNLQRLKNRGAQSENQPIKKDANFEKARDEVAQLRAKETNLTRQSTENQNEILRLEGKERNIQGLLNKMKDPSLVREGDIEAIETWNDAAKRYLDPSVLEPRALHHAMKPKEMGRIKGKKSSRKFVNDVKPHSEIKKAEKKTALRDVPGMVVGKLADSVVTPITKAIVEGATSAVKLLDALLPDTLGDIEGSFIESEPRAQENPIRALLANKDLTIETSLEDPTIQELIKNYSPITLKELEETYGEGGKFLLKAGENPDEIIVTARTKKDNSEVTYAMTIKEEHLLVPKEKTSAPESKAVKRKEREYVAGNFGLKAILKSVILGSLFTIAGDELAASEKARMVAGHVIPGNALISQFEELNSDVFNRYDWNTPITNTDIFFGTVALAALTFAYPRTETKPAVESGETKPAVESGETKPAVESGETKPAVESGETKPAVESGETDAVYTVPDFNLTKNKKLSKKERQDRLEKRNLKDIDSGERGKPILSREVKDINRRTTTFDEETSKIDKQALAMFDALERFQGEAQTDGDLARFQNLEKELNDGLIKIDEEIEDLSKASPIDLAKRNQNIDKLLNSIANKATQVYRDSLLESEKRELDLRRDSSIGKAEKLLKEIEDAQVKNSANRNVNDLQESPLAELKKYVDVQIEVTEMFGNLQKLIEEPSISEPERNRYIEANKKLIALSTPDENDISALKVWNEEVRETLDEINSIPDDFSPEGGNQVRDGGQTPVSDASSRINKTILREQVKSELKAFKDNVDDLIEHKGNELEEEALESLMKLSKRCNTLSKEIDQISSDELEDFAFKIRQSIEDQTKTIVEQFPEKTKAISTKEEIRSLEGGGNKVRGGKQTSPSWIALDIAEQTANEFETYKKELLQLRSQVKVNSPADELYERLIRDLDEGWEDINAKAKSSPQKDLVQVIKQIQKDTRQLITDIKIAFKNSIKDFSKNVKAKQLEDRIANKFRQLESQSLTEVPELKAIYKDEKQNLQREFSKLSSKGSITDEERMKLGLAILKKSDENISARLEMEIQSLGESLEKNFSKSPSYQRLYDQLKLGTNKIANSNVPREEMNIQIINLFEDIVEKESNVIEASDSDEDNFSDDESGSYQDLFKFDARSITAEEQMMLDQGILPEGARHMTEKEQQNLNELSKLLEGEVLEPQSSAGEALIDKGVENREVKGVEKAKIDRVKDETAGQLADLISEISQLNNEYSELEEIGQLLEHFKHDVDTLSPNKGNKLRGDAARHAREDIINEHTETLGKIKELIKTQDKAVNSFFNDKLVNSKYLESKRLLREVFHQEPTQEEILLKKIETKLKNNESITPEEQSEALIPLVKQYGPELLPEFNIATDFQQLKAERFSIDAKSIIGRLTNESAKQKAQQYLDRYKDILTGLSNQYKNGTIDVEVWSEQVKLHFERAQELLKAELESAPVSSEGAGDLDREVKIPNKRLPENPPKPKL